MTAWDSKDQQNMIWLVMELTTHLKTLN